MKLKEGGWGRAARRSTRRREYITGQTLSVSGGLTML